MLLYYHYEYSLTATSYGAAVVYKMFSSDRLLLHNTLMFLFNLSIVSSVLIGKHWRSVGAAPGNAVRKLSVMYTIMYIRTNS